MSAHGDNPELHRIVDGRFVCSAPPEAPCRTSPTCDCEQWCGCDGSPEDRADNHDTDHCCMTGKKSGQGCWIEPWINADIGECYASDDGLTYTADHLPDGPVTVEWEGEYCEWTYSDGRKPLPRCQECAEPIREDDLRASHGMCRSCVHDAMRSGWDPGPERLPRDPDQLELPVGGA